MNMNKYNISYTTKNRNIPFMVTVLAYSIKTAAQEFNTFCGMLKIVKIEETK